MLLECSLCFVNPSERKERHKTLTERCRSDPEAMADLILDLMEKVEQLTAWVELLEDQLQQSMDPHSATTVLLPE